MTELRRRMDDDMVARGLAERTRESYLWAVTGLARFYRRSPDQISDEEVQAYLRPPAARPATVVEYLQRRRPTGCGFSITRR